MPATPPVDPTIELVVPIRSVRACSVGRDMRGARGQRDPTSVKLLLVDMGRAANDA